jgi:flagellar hook assembly protein FlgD
VRLDVIDLAGRRITTLVDEVRAAGEHSVMWDGTDRGGRSVAAGTYLYRLETADFSETRSMTLAR